MRCWRDTDCVRWCLHTGQHRDEWGTTYRWSRRLNLDQVKLSDLPMKLYDLAPGVTACPHVMGLRDDECDCYEQTMRHLDHR